MFIEAIRFQPPKDKPFCVTTILGVGYYCVKTDSYKFHNYLINEMTIDVIKTNKAFVKRLKLAGY